MSDKAVTSIAFSIKKKEPSKVIKNSVPFDVDSPQKVTKKVQKSTKNSLQTQESLSQKACSDSKDQLLEEEDAIQEILRDTKRGATRAELSGSWRPPPSKINSRLFINTLTQTLQSNQRKRKSSSSEPSPSKKNSSIRSAEK